MSVRAAIVLLKGIPPTYFCSKCEHFHHYTSEIGREHLNHAWRPQGQAGKAEEPGPKEEDEPLGGPDKIGKVSVKEMEKILTGFQYKKEGEHFYNPKKKMETVWEGPAMATVEVKIHDKYDEYAGEFTVRVETTDEGKSNVYIELFEGPGGGYGRDFFDYFLKKTRSAGADQLELMAAMIGKYFWATKGFGFENEGDLHSTRKQFDRFLQHHKIELPANLTSQNFTQPWEFACFTAKDKEGNDYLIDGNSVGKDFMLHIVDSWDGVFDLAEGSASHALYESYMKHKKPSLVGLKKAMKLGHKTGWVVREEDVKDDGAVLEAIRHKVAQGDGPLADYFRKLGYGRNSESE